MLVSLKVTMRMIEVAFQLPLEVKIHVLKLAVSQDHLVHNFDVCFVEQYNNSSRVSNG
jgi:hypothetical protein